MKTEVFYCKSDVHVRPMRFSILSTSADSSDKTQLMCYTNCCAYFHPNVIYGSRLNYPTVPSNKFECINM